MIRLTPFSLCLSLFLFFFSELRSRAGVHLIFTISLRNEVEAIRILRSPFGANALSSPLLCPHLVSLAARKIISLYLDLFPLTCHHVDYMYISLSGLPEFRDNTSRSCRRKREISGICSGE